MSARDAILADIRRNRPAGDFPSRRCRCSPRWSATTSWSSSATG